MNCGFPLKASGETDFPCITGSRVGQGRVYVQLGKVDRIDFKDWVKAWPKGRMSRTVMPTPRFTVDGKAQETNSTQAAAVTVKAKVAFAGETPLGG